MTTLTLKQPLAREIMQRVLRGKAAQRELLAIVKPTTAIEKRRQSRILQRAVALELLRSRDERQMDEELMPTNRVLERWASGSGSGLPQDDTEAPRSKPPPLDGVTHTVVDQILMSEPVCWRFVKSWYRGTSSTQQMADMWGISRSGLVMRWRSTLFQLRGRFLDSGHEDLVKLLDPLKELDGLG